MNATRYARRLVAMVASAALLGGVGAFATGSSAIADSDRVTATAGVNVRSGPGTNYDLLGGLYPGYVVKVRGASQNGWTPVLYNGREAWVSSKYLKKVGTAASAPTAGGTAALRTIRTTVELNVRSGPGTTYPIVTVAGKGSLISTTGRRSKGFSEITWGGKLRWVSTEYLKAAQPTASSRGVRVMYSTAVLDIRSTSTAAYRKLGEIPKGAKVSTTGVVQSGRAQIVWGKGVAWVTANYLRSAGTVAPTPKPTPKPTTPAAGGSSSALPKVVGVRYATTALMIRTAPGAKFTNLGDVPAGTKLSITGRISSGRMQIVYKGAVRWVTAQYLSKSRISTSTPTNTIHGSGLTTMKANTKALLAAIRVQFPQFTTFYGVRPDAIPDHPSGRALDAMLPGNYRSASSRAYALALANWARANASSLHIEYIIWDQHIWNIKRANEGWRFMSDRGSDNANHKNHVHITVYG